MPGDLYAWGQSPALGHGDGLEIKNKPTQVKNGLPKAFAIACTGDHTLAIQES